MSTHTESFSSARSDVPLPFDGFDWGGLVQICQALRSPTVRGLLFGPAPSFDPLAWEPRRGDRPLSRADLESLRERLQFFFAQHGQPRWRGTTRDVARAVTIVARENRRHPVLARLSAIAWDGEARLGRVAAEVLGVDVAAAPHAAQLVRKWFLAAVARVVEPGCPADPVLTLVTPPDSARLFFRLLVAPSEYGDLPTPLQSRAEREALRRCWLWQRDDLPVLAERDPEAVAALLGRAEDPVDSFFAEEDEVAPRTTLFVSQVDALPALETDALRRRFWLVRTGALDAAKLERWADQLWAEALVEHAAGASWRLTAEESEALLRDHQRLGHRDPWEPIILDYMAKRQVQVSEHRWPSMAEILKEALRLQPEQMKTPEQMRAARILRRLGYAPVRSRVKAVRIQVWRPEEPTPALPPAEGGPEMGVDRLDRLARVDSPPKPLDSKGFSAPLRPATR